MCFGGVTRIAVNLVVGWIEKELHKVNFLNEVVFPETLFGEFVTPKVIFQLLE